MPDVVTDPGRVSVPASPSVPLAVFTRLFLFVFVNRNRIQILCLKNLTAIEAADIVDSVAAMKELSPLVLTARHSEYHLF